MLRVILRGGLLVSLGMLLLACARGGPPRTEHMVTLMDAGIAMPVPARGDRPDVLRVASLNMAHGRKDSLNQLFLSRATIRRNLTDIADVLREQRPDVVALQEADAASWWSGGFDHVAYIAAEAGYPWHSHAHNVDSWFSTYGTALLSRLPLSDALGHTFAASPPTLSKGLTLASIHWPSGAGAAARTIDLISVHLDFSRRSVREMQIREMQALLAERNNPTIIMGDFNSEWFKEQSVIKALAERSRFRTFAPTEAAYRSYKNKRLDWILISNELQFVDYRVIDDVLSDHAMLLAEIRFRGRAEKTASKQGSRE